MRRPIIVLIIPVIIGALFYSYTPADANTTRNAVTKYETPTTTQPDPVPTTPQPDIAITLEPLQTVKVLTVEQWHAVRRIHPDRQVALARIAWCESRFDAHAVGDGGYSFGAWQVQPRFWGPVPTTLEEQAEQADRIAAEHGLEPWTTRHGCDEWSG